jgi:hypothetical protein
MNSQQFEFKQMKISHWILVSLCFAGLAVGASVFLFTMLPINGAVISLCVTSLLARRFHFKIKGYLVVNFGFVILFTIVGYIAAMNDLRDTPWFSWMFFEVY